MEQGIEEPYLEQVETPSGGDQTSAVPIVKAGRRLPWLALSAVALLAVIAVSSAVIAINSKRMVTEQRRTTCYARLEWLTPRGTEPGAGSYSSEEIQAATGNCRGSDPRIDYDEP